jgi:hypothetical protein
MQAKFWLKILDFFLLLRLLAFRNLNPLAGAFLGCLWPPVLPTLHMVYIHHYVRRSNLFRYAILNLSMPSQVHISPQYSVIGLSSIL